MMYHPDRSIRGEGIFAGSGSQVGLLQMLPKSEKTNKEGKVPLLLQGILCLDAKAATMAAVFQS